MSRKKNADMQLQQVDADAKRTARVGIRLAPEVKRKAELVAKLDKRNLSNWVEKLITDAIEEAEKKGRH